MEDVQLCMEESFGERYDPMKWDVAKAASSYIWEVERMNPPFEQKPDKVGVT